jgi:hypothetical protein
LHATIQREHVHTNAVLVHPSDALIEIAIQLHRRVNAGRVGAPLGK